MYKSSTTGVGKLRFWTAGRPHLKHTRANKQLSYGEINTQVFYTVNKHAFII